KEMSFGVFTCKLFKPERETAGVCLKTLTGSLHSFYSTKHSESVLFRLHAISTIHSCILTINQSFNNSFDHSFLFLPVNLHIINVIFLRKNCIVNSLVASPAAANCKVDQ